MGSRESVSWVICGVIAAVLVGLVLFGGGGGTASHDGAVASGDQARTEITSVIRRFLAVPDPAECTNDVTPALLRQNFGGSDPLETCRRVNTSDAATTRESDVFPVDARVSDVTVHGGAADASVLVSGGFTDGSQVSVNLVRDDGRWKVDHIAVSHLDRGGFDRAIRRGLTREGASAREADCVLASQHRAISDQELESKLLNASSYGTLSGVGLGCLRRATLLTQIEKLFALEMQSRGLPTAIGECVADRLVQRMNNSELRAFVTARHATARQHAEIPGIARSCAQDYANGVLPRPGSS